jgi:phage terminase large subunit-like protein
MTDLPSTDELELELETEKLRRALRGSFALFAARFWPVMTGMPYPENTATKALCAAFQAVADGKIWRLLVAIAPGIGKSTMLALYSAWRLARRADWRSLHAMAAALDANRESLRVRRLVEHDDFRLLFPDVELAADENTISAWATTKLGRYFALGRDGAITSKRVLEAVIDDPMTAADRHSKAERDAVWTWLDESLKSRLDGDRAPIIIVAQRLDRDDVHARCMASPEHWCMLEPAAERDGRGLELRDHAGELVWQDDRAPDELIAPQMLSREKLAGLSKSVRTVQYQQRPDEDAGGGTIARTAWRFHAPAGANPNAPRPNGCAKPEESPTVTTPTTFDALVISCDPTFGGTKTENDFCSIQVWGRAPFGDANGYYLLARWHERAKQIAQREELKTQRGLYSRAAIVIENTAGGPGMGEQLEAEGVKDVHLEGTGGLAKAARLDNVSTEIEQGFVFLPIGMPDLQGFVDELAGMTVHDDDMDACSQALRWLKVEAPTDVRKQWSSINRGLRAVVGRRR